MVGEDAREYEEGDEEVEEVVDVQPPEGVAIVLVWVWVWVGVYGWDMVGDEDMALPCLFLHEY